MPRPQAELRGRLRYRACGPGPRLSLLHVRLSGAPGPVIAFQGSQGALEATILHEYSPIKKSYPSCQQEKNRCEYLHQKLSHIKSLILQFERSGSS